jgi:hypothetical protein
MEQQAVPGYRVLQRLNVVDRGSKYTHLHYRCEPWTWWVVLELVEVLVDGM